MNHFVKKHKAILSIVFAALFSALIGSFRTEISASIANSSGLEWRLIFDSFISWIAFVFSILFIPIFITSIYFYKLWKKSTSRKSSAREALREASSILSQYASLPDEDEIPTNLIEDSYQKIIDSFAEYFKSTEGHQYHISVKICHDTVNEKLHTYFRSSGVGSNNHAICSNRWNQALADGADNINARDNTAFCFYVNKPEMFHRGSNPIAAILIKLIYKYRPDDYFMSNNLLFLNLIGAYKNTRDHWSNFYRSTAVVPIYSSDTEKDKFYGFLCCDSYDGTFHREHARILQVFADILTFMMRMLESRSDQVQTILSQQSIGSK